jgi:hypothetical protein
MASMFKEIVIDAPAEEIWSAVRDVGALHTRLVPGFVTDCKLEGETRVVTFGNGATLREPILSVDDARKRMAWTVEGDFARHYNAVMHVIAQGAKTRVTWTSDFLPHGLGEQMGPMQDQGLATMKAHFERSASASRPDSTQAAAAPRAAR